MSTAVSENAPATTGFGALGVLMASLLVFAPLMRSGQTPIAMMVLEIVAVGLLLAVFWLPKGMTRVTTRELVGILTLLILPVLYLVPLPAALVATLPGRAEYQAVIDLVTGGAENGWRPMSLYPQETLSAWLALLPPVAVYLGTRASGGEQVLRLAMVVMVVAALQAMLGLMQYGAGSGPLFLGMDPIRRAIGTYTNPNHLAGLIALVLPVVLGLYVYSLGRRDHLDGRRGWRQRLSFLGTVRGHKAFWFGALAVLLLVGVIFTRSRAGIGLVILGIVLATLLFSRRIGGDNVYGTPGTVVAVAVGLGAAIGLAPVFDRFSAMDTVENARVTIWSHTLDGIGRFFPIGSGPGTYPDVFPAFQPLELGRWFINHAHNDYLEWLFEGGVLVGALMLYLLWIFLAQWVRLLKKGEWTRYRFLQVGAGIGLLLLMLHELVDYNLMMPANAVYFAFFASVFMRDFTPDEELARPRRRTHRMESSPSPFTIPAVQPKPAAPQPAVAPQPAAASQPEVAPAKPEAPAAPASRDRDWNPFMDE